MTTTDEAKTYVRQHKTPCHDCPWRRASIKGWLGPHSPEVWLQVAHSDQRIDCHTRLPHQCVGSSMFRANRCKSPRDPDVLQVNQDKIKVFSTDQEFLAHHKE